MATIHLIDGEKGGVGKSMFCRVLAHYFETEKVDFTLIDTDSRLDVADCYDSTIRDITFKAADEELAYASLQAQSVDRIFKEALEKPVLVNLPANVHDQLSFWIEDSYLLDESFSQESGVKSMKWFLCSGEHDSWNCFLTSLKRFGGKLPHVLVRNRGLGLLKKWSELETSEEYQNIRKDFKFLEVDFAGLRKQEQIYLQKNHLPLGLLVDDTALDLLSKQRLKDFLKKTAASIKNTGLVIQENHSKSKKQGE